MIQLQLTDDPNQKFSLLLDNQRVTFHVWYSPFADRWSFDMAIDGEYVLVGRRIVIGVDLLAAFDFGVGAIFAYSERGYDPDRTNLPDGTVNLYSATQAEIDAAVAA